MSRHTPLMPALALSLLAATACSGGQSGSPIAGATPGGPTPAPASVPTTPLPEAAGSHALGGFAADGDLLAGALALYTVDVDPDTLSAAARLKETRQGAANDDLYLLSISNFLRPTSFEVTAVSGNPGSLTLDYQFTHPFPAPADLDATPNAFSNRADLGITGMLLFLSDVADAAGNTYFDEGGAGKVVANTELVLDPDAYYRPAGLIDATGTANTFPYKAIVDERLDPRTSTATGTPISNGGDPTGNFGADGWTRDDMGATHDGWTGYGYLHGGQTARNSLRLGRNALENTGPFSLDVAVIAKYQDPRGGANSREKRANRLPPPAPDHTRFAYRGNHSALDVERIAFAGESGGFISNQVSASTLSF
ncbi:MAG TPA: hypothetical protein VEI97_19805, partial [bacterium]|nr:hypothetical protein [bacterium]